MEKEELVQAFKDYNVDIYNYVYYRSGQSQEIAEDITQDVFMKALRYKKSFDKSKSSIKTWLHVIARNLLVDFYKSKKTTSSLDETMHVVAEEGNEDKQLMYNQAVKHLKYLNDDEKELIVMRYIEELEIKEIAEIQGKQYNATKVAIHRALQKLRRVLSDSGFENIYSE